MIANSQGKKINMHLFGKSFLGLAALLVLSSPVVASNWPKAAVDKALQSVAKIEKNSLEECVVSYGTKIVYDVRQKDINGDGVNELIVASFPSLLGNGVTGCYGMTGKNMYVFSSVNGTWVNLAGSFGNDVHDFEFYPRKSGEMPDIMATGPGFCFPIVRFYKGTYNLWKVCNRAGEQVFADAAPWINFEVVPHDFGEESTAGRVALQANATGSPEAPEFDMRSLFDHNGSDVIVQPGEGKIAYEAPKKSISGAVFRGMILFTGQPWDPYDDKAIVKGTAYVFKKGCMPAPYEVSGRQEGWHTLVLKGPAPVREKNGCDVVGYEMNGNSTLKFVTLSD